MLEAVAEWDEQLSLSFEGLEVSGLRFSLTGTNGALSKPLRIGDEVEVTVRAVVERVIHGGSGNLVRLHQLKPTGEGAVAEV